MTWSGILEVTSNSLIEISRCFSPTIMISANEFRVLFFSQQHPTTLTPFSLAFLTASIIDSVSPLNEKTITNSLYLMFLASFTIIFGSLIKKALYPINLIFASNSCATNSLNPRANR